MLNQMLRPFIKTLLAEFFYSRLVFTKHLLQRLVGVGLVFDRAHSDKYYCQTSTQTTNTPHQHCHAGLIFSRAQCHNPALAGALLCAKFYYFPMVLFGVPLGEFFTFLVISVIL